MIDRLAQRFNATMLGVQIVGLDHIIAVTVSEAGSSIQLSTQVGSRFPALISATGRCIAAFGDYPAAEIERRFRSLRWDDAPSFAVWQEQVALTRERGFAVDDGNYIAGVTVLAAPVWKGRGKLSHALVAIGIGSAIGRVGLSSLGEALVAGAHGISAQLGGG
ncbi:MAG: IclR family transcriptional regulator C-terminal domain-containing protein [Sphingomicrobium sp.]